MKFVLEHIGLPARDPGKLSDWYVHTLGGEVVWQDVAVPVYFVRLGGGVVIEIYGCARSIADTTDNAVAGFRHVAMRVESIELAKSELARRGVMVTEPVKPAGGGGKIQFFSDPEGNLLHLVERPFGSPLAAG